MTSSEHFLICRALHIPAFAMPVLPFLLSPYRLYVAVTLNAHQCSRFTSHDKSFPRSDCSVCAPALLSAEQQAAPAGNTNLMALKDKPRSLLYSSIRASSRILHMLGFLDQVQGALGRLKKSRRFSHIAEVNLFLLPACITRTKRSTFSAPSATRRYVMISGKYEIS